MADRDDTKDAGSSDSQTQGAGGVGKVAPIRAKRPCPECGRQSARDTYPFCSTRCKNLDLNRWLSGAYAIPVREAEGQPADEEPPQDDG